MAEAPASTQPVAPAPVEAPTQPVEAPSAPPPSTISQVVEIKVPAVGE